MWLALSVILIMIVGFIALANGFIPPPGAIVLVRIRKGKPEVTKGSIPPFARNHLEDILRDGSVQTGFISISTGHRVTFSRHIPPAIHQRIRNVLLNQ